MKKDSLPYVLGFMLAISVFFGAGVSLVHHGTKDMLARNEQLHRNRTIAQAFELSVEGRDAEAFAAAVQEHIREKALPSDQRTWTVFERITDAEDQADVGFIFQGQGVWDLIRGIIVLSPDLTTVRNIRFLQHAETPGLGGRIEEDWFLEQFQGLSIAWDRPRDRRVIIGQALDPNAPNRVDAITGATGTSQALMDMLNNELHRFREAYLEASQDALHADDSEG
ncbi:FMN-binding protein [Desulfonatronum thiodismutans]|uniref:FMN-binding protein n=1 Tax=Desulfonatronum thiodismutans TaxID=159290 RepID=UPI00068A8FE0|nr:FMN-binding protein [Desulfonatronum thiodismutans]